MASQSSQQPNTEGNIVLCFRAMFQNTAIFCCPKSCFTWANDLIVGNTFFKHHPRRLWTWRSPGNLIKNEIDYILIQRRWRSSLLNVRTRPGADCGSDHQLLVAYMKLKLTTKKRETPPVRYDVEEIPEHYSFLVRNKFQVLLT